MNNNTFFGLALALICSVNSASALMPLPDCIDPDGTEYWGTSEIQHTYFLSILASGYQKDGDSARMVLSSCSYGIQLQIDYVEEVDYANGRIISDQIIGFIESKSVYTLADMANYFVETGFQAEVVKTGMNICVCSLEGYER